MKYFTISLLLVIIAFVLVKAQIRSTTKLIFKEDFTTLLDTALWKVELQPSPGSTVKAGDGKLVLQTGEGVTVWLRKKLAGNIIITYDRVIPINGDRFDRLSDLNQFFMAQEPTSDTLINRNGQLDEYNNLSLYYIGVGGNYNTTTRFRKYDGKGNRTLLQEHLDSTYLLQNNKVYHIQTEVINGRIRFYINDQLFFDFKDAEPLIQGYFGFRSTKSHQEIENFKVFKFLP